MPTCKLSPVFNDEQFSNAGLPLSGGQLFWYLAGTTTPATTYTDSLGITPQANPIILNVRGEPTNPIWLPSGSTYKAVLEDSLGNILRSIDNISGINDTATTEWLLYSGVATYISATSFSVVGDQTSVFTVNRRIKAAVSGGTVYASIATSVFSAGVTTITTTNDSTVLDSGLSSMYYGFLDPLHPSIVTRNINFTSIASTGNFTTPVNITTATVFKITLVGGGAGGGAGINLGGGGGPGGVATFYISGLSPSTAYAVVIGAGGTGGVYSGSSAPGGVGGTTQITINTIVYSAGGGLAGTANSSPNSIVSAPGAISASILALPNVVFYPPKLTSGALISGVYIGSPGGSTPFGIGGEGGNSTGSAGGSPGASYGGGGGGGVGANGGGSGAPGLFTAEWVA